MTKDQLLAALDELRADLVRNLSAFHFYNISVRIREELDELPLRKLECDFYTPTKTYGGNKLL